MSSYIIELKTSQVVAMKILMDTINSLILDAKFIFHSPSNINTNTDKTDLSPINNNSNTGLTIREVNKTGTILIYAHMDPDKFDVYNYNYPQDKFTIGVDISTLLKCLKCVTHFDIMTWLVSEDDLNKLVIILESTEKKEKKTFKVNLIDIKVEEYQIDPISFPYCLMLPSNDFHKYCKDMSCITDKIEIKATNNKLFFAGKGDGGSVEFEISESSGGLSIISAVENNVEIVQGLFDIKFLLIFAKCTNISSYVSIYLKNNYPVVIYYSIAALGEIKLVLSQTKL
jgi:proliferating cell nuclear antigen